MKLLSHHAEALALGEADNVPLGDSLGVGLTLWLFDPDGEVEADADLLVLGDADFEDDFEADGVALADVDLLALLETEGEEDMLALFDVDGEAERLALGEDDAETEAVCGRV